MEECPTSPLTEISFGVQRKLAPPFQGRLAARNVCLSDFSSSWPSYRCLYGILLDICAAFWVSAYVEPRLLNGGAGQVSLFRRPMLMYLDNSLSNPICETPTRPFFLSPSLGAPPYFALLESTECFVRFENSTAVPRFVSCAYSKVYIQQSMFFACSIGLDTVRGGRIPMQAKCRRPVCMYLGAP